MGVLEDLTPTWADDIKQLEVTDAIVGGPDGNDNIPHRQLAERTLFLRARQDELAATVQDHAGRVERLEASGTTATADALRISWALSDRGFDFELFVPGHSWRDVAPVDGVATVAGDDSIDVASTAGLLPGQTYVIHEGGTVQATITVAQILSATRLRATAPIGVSLAGATLARTSWAVQTGGAVAGDGGVLFSRTLSALRFTSDGRAVIRRDAGDGTLSVAWRRSGETAWTEGRLLSTAERAAGTRDEEWAIGGGAGIELRVTAAHGPSATDTRVHFLVALTAPEAGAAMAVRQPTAVDPAPGEVSVGETPTLTGSAFHSLYGLAQGGAEVRVALDEGMKTIVHSAAVVGAATAHVVPAGKLQTGRTYWWDLRYQDIEGVWSPWSAPAGFATSATFTYIVKPAAVAPAPGATGVSLTPTLQSSAFAVHGGADIHVASRWRVYADAACTDLVHDHTVVPPAGMTAYTLPAGALSADTAYWWTVEHQGQTLGWSLPSLAAGLRTLLLPAAPANIAPAAGAVAVPRPVELRTSAFYLAGGADAHVGTQYVVARDAAMTDILYDSGQVADLTLHTVSPLISIPTDTEIWWCARHKGASSGWGPYSAPTSFRVAQPTGRVAFTTPGTHEWEVPADVYMVRRAVTQAAGGGSNYGGGGAGGRRWMVDIPVVPGQRIPVAVGAPGVSGTSATAGGSSSFGAWLTAYGGQPGSTSGGGVGGGGAGGNGGGGGGNGGNWDGGSYGGGGGGAAGDNGNGGRGGNGGQAGSPGSGGGGGGGGGSGTGGAGGGGSGIDGTASGQGGAVGQPGQAGSGGASGRTNGMSANYGGGGGNYGAGAGGGGNGSGGAAEPAGGGAVWIEH